MALAADWPAPLPSAGLLPHQMIDCDDRPKINITIGSRYNQPCSSNNNFTINFDAISKKPQRAVHDFRLHPCSNWNRLPQSPRERHSAYDVCRYCVAAVEHHPWHRAAEDDFLGLQPHNSTSNSTNHFLTRLCGLCEERETRLLNQRTSNVNTNNAIAPLAPPQAQQDKMEDFPRNTCTCKKSILDTDHLCMDHRRQHYLTNLPRLQAQRDLNRTWLRSIERINGKLIRRMGATQIRALNDRRMGVVGGGPILLRACRCGEDPISDIRNARVLQCMSCEGIVHVAPLIPLQANVPAVGLPSQLRHNSHTSPWKFRLRRRN